MKTSDITNEWVLANFDIDKERKTTTEVECLGESYYDPGVKVELNQYLGDLKTSVEKQTKHFIDNLSNNPKILVEVETIYGMYGDLDEKALMLYASHEVTETDEQVIKRITTRERGKIKKAEHSVKRKLENEEKERKEFERLQKKFGDIK